MNDWLLILAGFGLMLLTVLACISLLALGLIALHKRGLGK